MSTCIQPRQNGPEQAFSVDDPAWRAVVAASPVALMVADDNGIVRIFNAAAAELLGRDPATVINAPLEDLQPKPGGGLHMLVGGNPGDVPSRLRRIQPLVRGDGGTVTLDTIIEIVDLPDGRRLYVTALQEVNLADEVGDALGLVEERLAVVAANLPGIIFQRVRQTDGSVYYPFFSSGTRDILGYDLEDMSVGQNGALDCIHWADRDDYLARMERSARTLEPYTEELRVISRDGEVKWLSGTMRPEPMPNGDIMWDCVLIDVTDRMHAELRLEMIMDHAADCIITISHDGFIDSVNAVVERTFGYRAGELVGEPISVLMPESYGHRYQEMIREYLETGDSTWLSSGPRELRGRRKDGSVFPIELALSEVLTEGRRLFIGILRDITQRKDTEKRLQESEQRLLNIADNIQGIVFQMMMRPDGAVSFYYVSEGSHDVLGIAPEELLENGELLLDQMDPGDRSHFLDSLHRSAHSGEPMETDIKVVNRQREERWLRAWSKPRDMGDGTTMWDGVALDVTDRKRAEEELMFLAYYDPLTNLGNRSLFIERFSRAKDFVSRIDSWVAVLSLGLDRFSIINATLGHSVGDQVLRAAGRRLQDTLDVGDLICRASGDRFLVLLTGVSSDADIGRAVTAIQKAFDTPLQVDGKEFDLTLSVGVSVYPRDAADAESLIMHADAALDRAKREGPSSFHTFTEEMGAHAAKTLSMQHRIRRALDNEEFVAYFQPQVETRSGRIVGMEALARWVSPEHGLIAPGAFIDVAEEYGFIDAICEQVLRDACRWNRSWQEEGLAHVPVAVNISGRQFHNSRLLLNTVESVLRQCNLGSQYLELELTESSAMGDPQNAISVVRRLAERGIACAIDDFGTGYSSLSVLKQFPIRKLKIDRSFVMEVTTDTGDAAIVCAMIAMATALNLKVVAEGVETQEQLDFLHGVGCEQVQGFYFSKPLPAEDMGRLFRDKVAMPKPS